MTSKAEFTEEEWTRLKRAPFVAGMAISLADPGGPIEAFKETAATLKTVTGAAESGGRGELVDAVAREVAEELRRRQSPIAGFRPKGATAGVEILDELREDEEFERLLVDAGLIVQELGVVSGVANEGVAQQMAMFGEAIAKVPQAAR